ncbi:MAG: PQQ-dependent dehydrogenase, methanol/ethanol family [Pseudomonadota bacterium]
MHILTKNFSSRTSTSRWRLTLLLLAVAALGSSLAACAKRQAATAALRPAAAVDVARLAAAPAEPDNWLAAGRDANGSYFSPLKDVNVDNVGRLGFAWQYRLGTNRGLEATPLVIDGVMYASSNFGRVYALDAVTGAVLWKYDPQIDGQWGRYACCDAVNRGIVAFEGRIYVGALDGWLHALDASTGKLIWKIDTLIGRAARKPFTLTGAPVLAGDKIIVGNGGGDFAGARGYVTAYDLKTGAQRWRFFTVPHDPQEGPQEAPHLESAVSSWDPRHPWTAGIGGNVWDGMSYDPKLGLVYIGTANAGPYNSHLDGRHGGDELYAASIIAIRADSGVMAWYYQTVPGDRWDYDSTQKFVLADLDLAGQRRQVIMQAAKNGYYYVLDRQTGELLSAQNYAYVSWTRGLDAKGRPIADPSADYDNEPALVFPSESGAHNWQPMAFDASRGLAFIPVIEAGNVIVETSKRRAGLVEGQYSTPAISMEDYDPAALKGLYGQLPPLPKLVKGKNTDTHSRGVLRAWSVAEHKIKWDAPTASSWDGGVLATAGGLVFQGDANGYLSGYASDTGKQLAHLNLGSSMMAAPITYKVGGVQYVAIMAGYGGGAIIVGDELDHASAAYRYGNDGRIIVLKLDGGPPPLPPPAAEPRPPAPPARAASAAELSQGEVLYSRYCARCHVFGRSVLPDLRRLDPKTHAMFDSIVLGGAYRAKGMGSFDDVLSPSDAIAVHAYVIDKAWQLKESGSK